MARAAPFHDIDQARRNIAHIDDVYRKIDIEPKSPLQEMPDHFCRWREFIVMTADWHCRIRDHDRKAVSRRLLSKLLGGLFGCGVSAGHLGWACFDIFEYFARGFLARKEYGL